MARRPCHEAKCTSRRRRKKGSPMFVATGRGKCEVVSRAPLMNFLLYNFDIEGHIVKYEHQQGLMQAVIPYLDMGASATIIGYASRTGSESVNGPLSVKRAWNTMYALRKSVGTGGKGA